jgi:hypothetical protein
VVGLAGAAFGSYVADVLGRWYRRLDKGFFLFVELPVMTCVLVATTIAAALGKGSWTAALGVLACVVLLSPLQWRSIKRREQRAR